jgi:hypothetical protein
MLLPRRLCALAAAFGMSLAACGPAPQSATNNDLSISISASISSLEHAGWKARSVIGLPQTVSGVRQVGYLLVVSPDGPVIDVQFLETASAAVNELHSAEAKLRGFHGTTIDNTLVFTDPDGRTPVSSGLHSELVRLLGSQH